MNFQLINNCYENILNHLYRTGWKYQHIIRELVHMIRNARLSHEDNIEAIKIILQNIQSHDKVIIGRLRELYYLYRIIIDENITYDHFVAYHKALSGIKLLGRVNLSPSPNTSHYYFFIPTGDINYNVINKNRFLYYMKWLYYCIIKNRYLGVVYTVLYKIHFEIAAKSMKYFNYPQPLIDWILDPTSDQFLVFGYINGDMYYDYSLINQHIRMISNRDKIYHFYRIKYQTVVFIGKKYNDSIQMYYKYGVQQADYAVKIEYVFIKNIPIGGFLKCGFTKPIVREVININFDKYVSKLELPWRDIDEQ